MPEPLLVVLNVCLLILLYLFFARVLRAVWIEMKEPALAAASSRSGSKRQAAKPNPKPRKTPRSQPSRLVVASPEAHAGLEFALADEMTIGRAPGCTIVIDDAYVSSLHTRVNRRQDAWYVEDLGSKNGTFVNGRELSAPKAVRVGDHLSIGSNEWDFR